MSDLIRELRENRRLDDKGLARLLEGAECDKELFTSACEVRKRVYGNDVYIRGLIEISSYCRNDCYYCGIRRSNGRAERYRLTDEEIMSCCRRGYDLGFRTFVLQGGEDAAFTDERICGIVAGIKTRYPDCAVTLSLGEKTRESYEAYYRAGADRYLLRHETATDEHYRRLHPEELSLENRKRCLWELKTIGYQTGSGFMVGSPYQRTADLISDMRFLQELEPDMIGLGPYISHCDTPFRDFPDGELNLCLRVLAILRHMFPDVLLPATTALGTIHPRGRELGLMAGANVIMPNLSPISVREKYKLYDNKICTGDEAAENLESLKETVKAAGYRIVTDRGDRRIYESEG